MKSETSGVCARRCRFSRQPQGTNLRRMLRVTAWWMTASVLRGGGYRFSFFGPSDFSVGLEGRLESICVRDKRSAFRRTRRVNFQGGREFCALGSMP